MNKSEIIDKIKGYLDLKTDADLCRYLEIKPNVLTNWKIRESLNVKLIVNKCPEINPTWLITGEGEMLLNNEISTSNVKGDINQLNKTIMDLNEKIKLMEENKALSEELISVQRKHIAFLESAMNIAEAKKKESNVG